MKPQQKYHLGTASNNYPGWWRWVTLAAWCKPLLKKLQWAASCGHTENAKKNKKKKHCKSGLPSDESTPAVSECEDKYTI